MSIAEGCPNKSTEVAYQRVDNETVIVSPRQRVVNVLNEVGSRIWQLSDGSRKIEDIAEIIGEEFAVGKAEALADISEFVNELVDKSLMTLR
ncbi:MAG: PqqD family protein [Candidatus Omnitrophota bacterium]